MADTWTDTELNTIADERATSCAYISIHDGDPGADGTSNEATGGSPAYARKAGSWSSGGAEGDLGASAQPATVGTAWAAPTFDLPAGTYTHYGYWSAASGGTYRGGGALSTSYVLASQGTLQPNVAVGPGPSGTGV